MVCDSGVTCDFSFFALKLSYSSIHIEKKKAAAAKQSDSET